MPIIEVEVVTIISTLKQHIFVNENEKCKEFTKSMNTGEYVYSIIAVPGEIYI
jgi:hypothetical protein